MSRNVYETNGCLAEYLLFHYSSEREFLSYEFGPREALNFPARCARLCREFSSSAGPERALDLGCAVGRSTFELADFCRRVTGVDFSKKFIDAARTLKESGSMTCARREEGEITSPIRVAAPADIDRSRVTFERGDARRLRSDLGVFDIVLAANLIDRLSDPVRFLKGLPSLVRSGGILVITSPYSWMEEFTPKNRWLGGVKRNGKAVKTLESLKHHLADAFSLAACRDMPFLIREHARKFQWCVAEATVWKRNSTKESYYSGSPMVGLPE